MSLIGASRLFQWLGPWTPEARRPPGIVQREIEIEGSERFRALVWRSEEEPPRGSLLLVPGLHYLGPAHPRLTRFGMVLAHAGFLVLSPLLPDYERLIVGKNVVPDAVRAFDALLAQPDRPRGRPGVFSISFGSLPALRLAALRSHEIESVLVFGGFADFRNTIRFALEGTPDRPNDPLNAPVVFLNLMEHLEGVPDEHRAPLAAAWREYCALTWGKPENKRPDIYLPIARRLAGSLPEAVQDVFLAGTRAAPGTTHHALGALGRSGSAFDWIDVRPHLDSIRCQVHLVHGRADDVIPHEESELLLRAMPAEARATRRLTGLYGHTVGEGLGQLVGMAGAAVGEVASLMGIVGDIARASR